MSQKIAVAIIHGVGKQDPNFAEGMAQELKERFAEKLEGKAEDPASELVIRAVYWAPVLQDAEDELWKRMKRAGELDFTTLRRFVVDFAADAIAYQPTPRDRTIYDRIHGVFAEEIQKLLKVDKVGEKAPLCVIAHSLGSVIASNYFYDLQSGPNRLISPSIRGKIGDTPLELGETLTLFYTLGSPLAIWSLRYTNPIFGVPIKVPSPRLSDHYPGLKGEWVNFYDEDDVLGYPLRTLNQDYKGVVRADRQVNVGGLLSSWNPASHLGYWTDNDVTKPIAGQLAQIWLAVNP